MDSWPGAGGTEPDAHNCSSCWCSDTESESAAAEPTEPAAPDGGCNGGGAAVLDTELPPARRARPRFDGRDAAEDVRATDGGAEADKDGDKEAAAAAADKGEPEEPEPVAADDSTGAGWRADRFGARDGDSDADRRAAFGLLTPTSDCARE